MQIRDRKAIEAYLRRHAAAHVYALADLDDFFWPDTTWYASVVSGELNALVLLLHTLDPPVLYSVCPAGDSPTRELLEAIEALLPPSVFANLSEGQESVFGAWAWEPHGLHHKMVLGDPAALGSASLDSVVPLGPDDLAELSEFYAESAYTAEERSARFFERYMLAGGPYFGIREGSRLVSAGGVHVFSRAYRVAAIGNVATRPDRRGRCSPLVASW